MPEPACRIDVWLWRARFFKTRALAAAVADAGRIRVTRREGTASRIDKASRTVRSGDSLIFVHTGRLYAIKVQAVGERRGPPSEAQALYEVLGDESASAPLTTRPPA